MLTTKGDDAKKKTILKLLAAGSKSDQLYSKKFGFRMQDTYWYQKTDPAFFIEVMGILKD